MSGNAFRMTDTMAAANTAKRCHPSWVNPTGMGANQMPAASARHRSFLIGLSYAAVVIGFALPTTGPDAPGP